MSRDLLDRIDAALAAGHVQPPALNYTAILAERLHAELPQLWVDAYHAASGHVPELVEFTDGANHYLFDSVTDRVAGAWGESRAAASERDRSRQAGFIPRFSRHYEGKDRGHFLSHGQGGLMDVNFFPQLKEVNRGWSAAGKLYRALERHAATHPGTFALSRPLYARDNDTWDPERLEYGLLLGGTLRAVVFPNRGPPRPPAPSSGGPGCWDLWNARPRRAVHLPAGVAMVPAIGYNPCSAASGAIPWPLAPKRT